MPRKIKLERTVKDRVKDLLDPHKPDLYYNMPVPYGYGKSMLDFVGCYRGLFFMVETKRAKKDLTGVQALCATEVIDAGGRVFIIRDYDGLAELEHWLLSLEG
jgi:hypothetical protein